MSPTELARALGIDKSGAARLIRKGCPSHSIDAAQAWRLVNARPRAKQGHPTASPTPRCAPPKASPAPGDSIDPTATGQDSAEVSVKRARQAEAGAFRELERVQKNGGSIDDARRANSTYVQSRSNRQRAEVDYRQWQRDEQILMFADEARDLVSRPHQAAQNLLAGAAKTLAIRCHGQPVKACEKTIGDWIDRLSEVLRASF